MKLRPLYDRMIIRPFPTEEKTSSGLILPGSKDLPIYGEVLFVGEGMLTDNGQIVPCKVFQGDVVLFYKDQGTPVSVGGEELLLLRENEILAIVEE